ncbi:exonuclease domain-containing protein [Georgenia sp. 10Sc9-8]|uniref:Exonuclease domain-containing protein n=1 Tax=Georgenia halotolerans TaxID=3028317 RepID=A0ABT5TYF6_9MICO|nr:exonuclease domain-containing protein [Georgenia halotolerans]
MSGWPAGPFLGFDTETTGVDVERDRIVTAALVRRDAAGIRVRTWLIDPGVDIPPAATAVHGITTERARAEGVSPARALSQIADELVETQDRGVPVVVYNAAYDLAILHHELHRHGLPTLVDRLGRECMPVIDPLVLDRGLDRDRAGKRKLHDLCRHYEVAEEADLHTAEVDVVATLDVLTRITDRFPQVARAPLAEVHRWQTAWHRDWAAAVNSRRSDPSLAGPGANPVWPMPVALADAPALT